MRNLLAFLAKYNYWFVFILLEVISFALLFRYNSFQGSVFFSSANAVAGKIYEYRSDVTTFFSMSQNNKRLTERNLMLEQEVKTLSQYIARNNGDSLVLDKYQKQMLNQVLDLS